MAYHNYFVGWICRCCAVQSIQNATASFEPAVVESLIYSASRTDVCRYSGKVGVRQIITEGFGAAKSENREGAGMIESNVARDIGDEGTVRVCKR